MPHSFCSIGSEFTLFSNVPKVLYFDVSFFNLSGVILFVHLHKFLFIKQTVVTLIRLGILWHLIRVYTICKCLQNVFGQNYFNLKGHQVCFAWCMFAKRKKSCTVSEQWCCILCHLIRVYTVCQSPQKCLWTDPMDRFIWKLRGVKFVLFGISLQKYLYFWQTVLTLNRHCILRLWSALLR